MTVYSWGSQSPLEKMEVLPFGKEREAVLFASANADPARLADISHMFQSQGLAAVPDEVDGQKILRLRGFDKEELPAAALEQNGFVDAAQRVAAKSEEKKNSSGVIDRVRDSSLKLSGYVYMIGDVALAVSGLKRGDANECMSGLAYGATSVVAARYGERKPEKVFDSLYSKMLGEFAKEGLELPKGTEITAKELGASGGLIERTEKFLYDYPTQVLTAGNVIAGFNLFRAGINQGNNDKRIAGALVTTGMLVGLLVPEKAKEDKPQTLDDISSNLGENAQVGDVWKKPQVDEKKGVVGTLLSPLKSVTDWVQEKPLRVGGYMAMGNNYFMLKGGLNERKTNPLQRKYLDHLKSGDTAGAKATLSNLDKKLSKGEMQELGRLDPALPEDNRLIDERIQKLEKSSGMWTMNIVAAASYLVANGLLSMSSKDGKSGGEKGGNEKKDPNDELYAAAAAIIANQPQEMQDTTIDRMSVFLASQREVHMEPAELAEKMREKVATVKDSPWLHPELRAQRNAVPQHVPLSVQENPQPATRWADAHAQDSAPAAWAEKEAARDSAAAETGLNGASR